MIDNFTERLQQDGTLFEDKAFTDQLADSVSLQEKLIHAFHICGGSPTVNSIEKLLDPNSYVDLFFQWSQEKGDIRTKEARDKLTACLKLFQ